MKSNQISKTLHLATLICFLLPFFHTGCEKQNETKKAGSNIGTKDSASNDSLAVKAISSSDSLQTRNQSKADSSSGSFLFNTDSGTVSEQLVKRAHILKTILTPEKDVSTGLGTVLDSIPYTPLFGVFASFLLLVLGLSGKFLEPLARKTIVLLEVLALSFLSLSQAANWESHRLWGYWVALSFGALLVVFDFYQAQKKQG